MSDQGTTDGVLQSVSTSSMVTKHATHDKRYHWDGRLWFFVALKKKVVAYMHFVHIKGYELIESASLLNCNAREHSDTLDNGGLCSVTSQSLSTAKITHGYIMQPWSHGADSNSAFCGGKIHRHLTHKLNNFTRLWELIHYQLLSFRLRGINTVTSQSHVIKSQITSPSEVYNDRDKAAYYYLNPVYTTDVIVL